MVPSNELGLFRFVISMNIDFNSFRKYIWRSLCSTKYILDIYIKVLPAGNLVGMCSTLYPGMSNLLVTRFFCDFLLAETHISTFVVSRLRRIFILSVHEESDACLY